MGEKAPQVHYQLALAMRGMGDTSDAQKEIEILTRAGDGRLGGARHFGFEPTQFFEHHVGAKDEIAGIPEIALVNKPLRRGCVRLFDESGDLAHFIRLGERRAGANIAKAGRWMIRLDSEGDDHAARGPAADRRATGDGDRGEYPKCPDGRGAFAGNR